MHPLILLMIVCGMVVLSLPLAAQERGKLGEFEEEVKKNEQEEHDDDEDEDDDEDTDYSFIGDIAELVFSDAFLYLFIGLEQTEQQDGTMSYSIPLDRYHFTDYPYAGDSHGMYTSTGGTGMSSVLSAQYLRTDDKVYGYTLRGRVSPAPFLSLEGRWTGLYEELFDYTDRLDLYSVFLNYHSVRTAYWTVRWGIGMQGLTGGHNLTGFAGVIATEIFPFDPVSLQLGFSLGIYNELTATATVHIDRAALSFGWQNFDAGRTSIGGLVGGIHVYF